MYNSLMLSGLLLFAKQSQEIDKIPLQVEMALEKLPLREQKRLLYFAENPDIQNIIKSAYTCEVILELDENGMPLNLEQLSESKPMQQILNIMMNESSKKLKKRTLMSIMHISHYIALFLLVVSSAAFFWCFLHSCSYNKKLLSAIGLTISLLRLYAQDKYFPFIVDQNNVELPPPRSCRPYFNRRPSRSKPALNK
eukprot:NODE_765_length_4070_cov_0.612692.p3 type:complete len:196 gc:universal NODE_765_length_4070_cov_0.612692:3988-3401(-)